MRRARVERLVNAMADAHDLLLLRQHALDVGVDFVFAADFLEHVDDAFVGAAVQRAFQRADGRGDGGIKIGQRRDGDARAEGRGVHAVIGVQDKRHVEGVARFLRLRLAVDQIKEMRGLGQIVAHRRQRFALARAMKIRGDDADLRRDAARAPLVDLARRFLVHLRIVKPSMETAVRITSIGLAVFGADLMKSITPPGNSRSARSLRMNSSSSVRFGSCPFHKRKTTSL